MRSLRALSYLVVCSAALVALMGAIAQQSAAGTLALTRLDLTGMEGAELYANLCADCHGVSGKGDGPVAPALDPFPTDLTRLAMENGGEFPSFAINRAIGREYRRLLSDEASMPCWGEVLLETVHDRAQVRVNLYSLTKHLESLQEYPQIQTASVDRKR